MKRIRLGVAGATGRMGRAVIRLAAGEADFEIVAAMTIPDDPAVGRDAGQTAGIDALDVPLSTTCDARLDVLIDFTAPAATRAWAGWCAAQGAGLVSGTTGLSDDEQAALSAAAKQTPVLWAPNMSVGVNQLLRLVADAAKSLGEEWNVEICEIHHNRKADAPSGTARALLERICEARGLDARQAAVHGRSGMPGPRKPTEIGVHALRLGDAVGEHEVHFAASGETLTLRHRASSRDIFAAGALRAARWIAGRPPGLYRMTDVLAE